MRSACPTREGAGRGRQRGDCRQEGTAPGTLGSNCCETRTALGTEVKRQNPHESRQSLSRRRGSLPQCPPGDQRAAPGTPLGVLHRSQARPATLPQTCRSVEGAGRVANASSPQFNFHSKQAMELWTGVSGLTADTGTHRGAAKLPLLLRRALRPRGPPGRMAEGSQGFCGGSAALTPEHCKSKGALPYSPLGQG